VLSKYDMFLVAFCETLISLVWLMAGVVFVSAASRKFNFFGYILLTLLSTVGTSKGAPKSLYEFKNCVIE